MKHRSFLAAVALLVTGALAVTGCSASSGSSDAGSAKDGKGAAKVANAEPAGFTGRLTANVRPGAKGVKVNRVMKVRVQDAHLRHATLRSKHGKVPGRVSGDRTGWTASSLLEPGTRYTLRALAVDQHGKKKRMRRHFRTQHLTLDEQTYPSFAPTNGATVGVAMPVIIKFDVPVTDKARIQRHLKVTSKPAQVGAWHWISDNEIHWRPKHYWKAGTKVTVRADIGSVPAGNGIYGQLDRHETFTIGRNQVTRVNLDTDRLTVHRDGKVIRTIPVTAGREPDYTTRSGTKVIVTKESHTRMNSETIGIDPNSAEGYDLTDVRYAMRLTFSGEYLHAAPWSVASQGHTNVSHGCTGMSTDNARWLFDHSLIGDPVVFTGTDRGMTLTNGYGDWNVSFKEYKKGSAL